MPSLKSDIGSSLKLFTKRPAEATSASQAALVVKNLPTEGVRGTGSIPALGRSPGVGNGNPLQYSCLEKFIDRGAWQATVHRVAKSQTRLK